MRSLLFVVALALLSMLVISVNAGKKAAKKHESFRLKELGCFKDIRSSRGFSQFLVSLRGKKYEEIIQECASLAKDKGFKMFGIQYFGECWSGDKAHETYNRNGPSESCADGIGGDWSNYVYEILEEPKWMVIFDFEKGRDSLHDWQFTGNAFHHQPTYGDNPTARKRGQPSHHQGNYWIGGYENRPSPSAKAGAVLGDKPKGTLTSPVFIINGNKLKFLIGGGCDMKTERIELLIEGQIKKTATGKCTETMAPYEWNVSCFIGKKAEIRLIDQGSGGWGHINFDYLQIWTDQSPTADWCPVFDFEGGRSDLKDWSFTGNVFHNQPTYGDNPTARRRKQPSNHLGDYWIGGYENRPNPSAKAGAIQGDGPQGTVTSPLFKITGNKMRFLIGGGCEINTQRVELLIDGKVVEKATGKCKETMGFQEWSLSCFLGQDAQIRLVDHGSKGWGHINVDEFDIWTDPTPKYDWCPLFDFEGGKSDLKSWTLTGNAFTNQPTYGDNPTARKRGQPSHHLGNYWIGGYENRPTPSDKAGAVQGDKPQGTLTSPPFKITGNKMRFLIGGGCKMETERVELLIDGKVVKKATGKCKETMKYQEWDVTAYVGKMAHVRLVDAYSEGWGHLNFDDLQIFQQ